jgi:hypothetical protein
MRPRWELWALEPPYSEEGYRDLVSTLINTDRAVRPGQAGAAAAEEPAPGWGALMRRCWAEEPEARPEFR